MSRYAGTWCSSLHPVIFGKVELTITEGQERTTPTVFEYRGRYKCGEKQNATLCIDRHKKTMSYDTVTFNVEHFGDIIQGTYSSSFPLVDKGRFVVAREGIPIPELVGSDNCILL